VTLKSQTLHLKGKNFDGTVTVRIDRIERNNTKDLRSRFKALKKLMDHSAKKQPVDPSKPFKPKVNSEISFQREMVKVAQYCVYELQYTFNSPIYKGLHRNRQFIPSTANHSLGVEIHNYIQEMAEEFQISKLREDKKPEVINRYVGIELEFCAPIGEVGLIKKFMKKEYSKCIQLKSDGSLRPKDNELAYEIAILSKEGEYKKILKDVLKVLASVGAEVDGRRCGLHVHLDMSKRNKELVYNNLVACQYSLSHLIDPSRLNGEFCRWVKKRSFPTAFNGGREERYKTINAASYYRHKTLEIRMHEGCLEFDTISNWVDLLIKIANFKLKIRTNIVSITSLKRKLDIKDKLGHYLIDRKCYWQVNGRRRDLDRLEVPRRAASGSADYSINNIPPPLTDYPAFTVSSTENENIRSGAAITLDSLRAMMEVPLEEAEMGDEENV
jgi:hypothetical protein